MCSSDLQPPPIHHGNSLESDPDTGPLRNLDGEGVYPRMATGVLLRIGSVLGLKIPVSRVLGCFIEWRLSPLSGHSPRLDISSILLENKIHPGGNPLQYFRQDVDGITLVGEHRNLRQLTRLPQVRRGICWKGHADGVGIAGPRDRLYW